MNQNVKREWEEKPGAEQWRMLLAAVWSARKIGIAHGCAWASVMEPGMIADIAAEGYIRMFDVIAEDESGDELGRLLFRAVTRAAAAFWRAETKHRHDETETDDGQNRGEFERQTSATNPDAENPEDATADRDIICRAAHAAGALDIVRLIGAGYTVREIAARLGLSPSATQRRIEKVRANIRTMQADASKVPYLDNCRHIRHQAGNIARDGQN